MFVYELLGSLRVRDLDFSDTLGSLVINELKYLDQVISVLVTFPEHLPADNNKVIQTGR